MGKRLIIVTLVFSIMLIFTTLSHNLVTIMTPYASASPNATSQEPNAIMQEPATSDSQSGSILTDVISTPQSTPQANQSLVNATSTAAAILESFERTVTNLIIGVAILIVFPLFLSMIIDMMRSSSTPKRQVSSRELFRLLVAVGVTFTVILIIVYLNTLVITLIAIGGPAVDAIIEIEENFLTIIGTAFASLIAFYFGSRGTQTSNAQRTPSITGPGTGGRTPSITGPGTSEKPLEVIDINPIKGNVGVEVDSQVTATFSTPIRTSTINENTFSVKNDTTGEYHKGNFTLTDNKTTITFNPTSPFNPNTRYIVTISKGIMDISGASLAEDMEWHFTTVV